MFVYLVMLLSKTLELKRNAKEESKEDEMRSAWWKHFHEKGTVFTPCLQKCGYTDVPSIASDPTQSF